MTESAIRATGLRKSYGDNEAVRGIDLDIARGEVFGFLGPNGAGKTTTIEILEGYRQRTAGEVSVLGVDPAHPTPAWRERVGLVLQECEFSPALTVRETLTQYASLYDEPRGVGETIDLVGLAGKESERIGRLSGGQKRRVDVAVGLIGDPELIFLDEPTTGFDPTARRGAWKMIEGLRDLGKTVFLTTHYMDEAQHLADRVAILRAGEIVAQGSPAELGSASGRTVITFRRGGREERIETEDAQAELYRLLAEAREKGETLEELEARRPTLEDVFLELTSPDTDGGGSE
jgi:ABC-2 type transport system ATP-binding protein